MTDFLPLGRLGGRADSDKSPALLAQYEPFLAPRRLEVRAVLELGVDRGGSLRIWREYFPSAVVVGVDERRADWDDERIVVRHGQQDDLALLRQVRDRYAPSGFDLIVDDAAHVGRTARASFTSLFTEHLRPGGVYAIEDWGTGYWADWPDGQRYQPPAEDGRSLRSHSAGMVGFIKHLVDWVGTEDASRTGPAAPATTRALLRALHVFPGLVVAEKAIP